LISVFVIFLISSFAIAQDEISPEEKSLLTLIALKWSNQCKENGLRADVKGCFTCHYDPRDFKKVRKVSLEIPRMYPAGSNMKLSADGKTVTCLVYEVNKVQWDIIRWTMEGKDYENVERIVLEIASVGGSYSMLFISAAFLRNLSPRISLWKPGCMGLPIVQLFSWQSAGLREKDTYLP